MSELCERCWPKIDSERLQGEKEGQTGGQGGLGRRDLGERGEG